MVDTPRKRAKTLVPPPPSIGGIAKRGMPKLPSPTAKAKPKAPQDAAPVEEARASPRGGA